MTLDQIKTTILNLDDPQLIELESYIKLILKSKLNKPQHNPNGEVEVFYSATMQVFNKFMGNHKLLPFPIFKTKHLQNYKLLVQQQQHIDEFFKTYQLFMRRKDKILFYTWLSSEVLAYMDAVYTTAPITYKSMLTQFTKVESFVEKAFPGYLRNGLFMLVLEKYRGDSQRELRKHGRAVERE